MGRITQRRGQLRIYMKDERNRERGIKKEQGKGGEEPSKMSDEQFKKLETTLREEKKWWITKEVRIPIKERFEIEYSEDQVVRIL